jgi:hypothetical protein
MTSRHQLLGKVALIAMALTSPTIEGLAQGREPLKRPASVPTDLATALASTGFFGNNGDPQILVGSLPEWVAARVQLPPGSRVLGSAFIGSTVLGVVTVPTSSDTLMKQFERELEQRGWTPPPTMPSRGGGFRPSLSAAIARAQRFTRCRENQVITGWISRQQAASTTVMLRMSDTGGNPSLCNPMQPQFQSDMERPAYPTLIDPSGASDASGCYRRYSGGTSGTGTRLKTTMSAEALLEHYGRQLQDSGWTPASTPGKIGRTWTRPDSAGALVHVSITVSSLATDSTCRDLMLEIQRPQKP